MAVVQLKTAQRLAVYDGDIWARDDLSFKARAMYAFLSTFPGSALPRVADVERLTGLGKDARQGAYRELVQAGLLVTRVGTWSSVSRGSAQ
jgi:hypothetical protein